MKSIIYNKIPEQELILAEKYAPCLIFDEKEPFLPKTIGISVFYKAQLPASLLFQKIRNHLTPKKKIRLWVEGWVLTLYHTMMNDRKTDPKPLALYKFYRNRPQPVLMQLEDKWKKKEAKKVIEYAIYYDSDIVHIYDLEHIWVYLDDKDEIIGVKGTRHGVIVTQYANPQEIKYFRGHPIIYSTPGKHSNIVTPLQLNRKILKKACTDHAGRNGIYDVQFFDDKAWDFVRKHDPGKQKIHQIYQKKYAFVPSFRMNRFIIPDRRLFKPWYELMLEIPNRIVDYLNNEVLNGKK